MVKCFGDPALYRQELLGISFHPQKQNSTWSKAQRGEGTDGLQLTFEAVGIEAGIFPVGALGQRSDPGGAPSPTGGLGEFSKKFRLQFWLEKWFIDSVTKYQSF